MSPAVSIVLPTFNRLRYLPAAIESVFAQTFTDWELIVADDGSEAQTQAYLVSVADPPRVRVLHLPHTGNPGSVRNAAWRSAHGEYIAFLDSDDIWSPEKLTLQLAALHRHPERGWSHTAFAIIDASGAPLYGANTRWPATEGWVVERLIRMEIVVATSPLIVRLSLLEQLAGVHDTQRLTAAYELW